MKSLHPFLRICVFLAFYYIGPSGYAQLELGHSYGMFLTDVAVDKNETHYLLNYYNSVQIFNKDGDFVRAFPIVDGPVYPSLKSIEVDEDGNLHIVDDANDVILVYDAYGDLIKQVTLEAGTYQDFAMDQNGRYYFAERSKNVVQIFDKEGLKLKEFGSGEFGSLYGIHVAANGNIFTCDIGVYFGKPAAVKLFDNDGNYISNIGVTSASGAYGAYTEPTAVQTDAAGYIYVYSYSKVIKYYPTFEFRQEYQVSSEAQGVHYAGYAFRITKDKLYFADSRHRVQVFNTSLAYQRTIAGFSADAGKFNIPVDVAVGEDDYIYVADSRNYAIHVFDANGTFRKKIGTYGSGEDQFLGLNDVAIEGTTNIVHVLDGSFVKKYNRSGEFIGSFDTGIRAASRMALDKNGLIYIGDLTSEVIKVFSSDGVQQRSIPVNGSIEGMTIGPDDLLYVTLYVQANVRRVGSFSLTGTLVKQFNLPEANRSFAYGLAVLEDYIFVSDSQGVRKFLKDGTFVARLSAGKGDRPRGLNMTLKDGGVFRPSLAIWKNNLLVSDALRVQAFPVKQSISFAPLPAIRYGDGPIEVAAASSAGLHVTFLVKDPDVASISNGVITVHKPGTTKIIASQDGDDFIDAAESVSHELVVNKGEQQIVFATIGDRILGESPIPLSAESNVGLPIEFSIENTELGKIESNVLTLLNEGTTTVRAIQNGNEYYERAENAQTITISLVTSIERPFKTAQVYPNPTRDQITVVLLKTTLPESISLLNNSGKRVQLLSENIVIDENRLEVSLSHVESGVYYLCIASRGQGMTVHKVIKL